MTCQRVLILHQGKILAADTTENLQRRMSGGGQVVAEIAAPAAELRACWETVDGVEHYEVAPADGEYCRCALTPQPGVDLRVRIFETVLARGWKLRELTRSRHSLEDIFVHITRADREEEGL
jgi:ABC-2 type transport system ATP-binding protein